MKHFVIGHLKPDGKLTLYFPRVHDYRVTCILHQAMWVDVKEKSYVEELIVEEYMLENGE